MRPSILPMKSQCADYESSGPTGDTTAGTNRHTVFAQLLTGQTPTAALITPEDLDAVTWAAEHVKTVAPTSDYPLKVETKLNPLWDDFTPLFEKGGTADVQCGPYLFDLKSRERDYLPQMAAYALGMIQADGWEAVTVYLLYTETKRSEMFILTEAKCWEVLQPIFDKIKAAAGPTPCDYCGWCKHQLTCPALLAKTATIARERQELPPEVKASFDTWLGLGAHSSQIEDPELMGAVLSVARTIQGWCDAVEFKAKEMALKAGKVPTGFKLQSRQGNRFIASVVEAFPLAGLPQAEFLKACDVKPSALFETYAAFHGLKKAAAERDLTTKLGDLIQRKPGTQSLVKSKD